MPSEITESTRVPLKIVAAIVVAALSIGAAGMEIKTLVGQQSDNDKKIERVERHQADQDKQLALLQQAVLDLHDIAKGQCGK